MKIRHVGITVNDLDKSIFFYQDLLGFKIEKRMNESGDFIDNISDLKNVSVTTVKLSPPEGTSESVMIELLKYHSHKTDIERIDINNGGITHFALTVNDIEELYTRLTNANVEFSCKPQLSADGGAIVTFCRDFENNLIEIVEVT
tara:strand:+ start:332 stop:766 length:435 start_codon:yes stop_codon:yes gene_type:complete